MVGAARTRRRPSGGQGRGPGYFVEGWSVKDLVAHIGSWLAEAGAVLERIRFGTYRPEELDIDAMNRTFYDDMHDVAFADVRAQGIAARNQMLRAWRSLPEEADRWIEEGRSEHYAQHLPRREWVRSSVRPGAPRARRIGRRGRTRAPRRSRAPEPAAGGQWPVRSYLSDPLSDPRGSDHDVRHRKEGT